MSVSEGHLGTTGYEYYKAKAVERGVLGLKLACLHKVSSMVDEGEEILKCVPACVGTNLVTVGKGDWLYKIPVKNTLENINLDYQEGADLTPFLDTSFTKNIQKLSVKKTGFSDAHLACLPTGLIHIDVQHCPLITAKAFFNAMQSLPNLTCLGLPPCVTPRGLASLNNTKLQSVLGSSLPPDFVAKLPNLTEGEVQEAKIGMKKIHVKQYSALHRDFFAPVDVGLLEELDMWVDGLECSNGTVLRDLTGATNLRVMNLLHTGIESTEGDWVAAAEHELKCALPDMVSLEELVVHLERAATTELLACLPASTQIVRLDGKRYNPDPLDVTPFTIKPLSNLTTLCLSSLPSVPSSLFDALPLFSSLRELVLIDLDQPAEAILPYLRSSSIRYLEVNGCRGWDDDTLLPTPLPWPHIAEDLPNLMSLLLYGIHPLSSGDILQCLSTKLVSLSCPTDLKGGVTGPGDHSLRYFNIGGDHEVTSDGVKELLLELRDLEVVQIENCPKVKRVIPFYLFQNLNELSLVGVALSDEACSRSIVGCVTLRSLVLDLLPDVLLDKTLKVIATLSLTTLSIYDLYCTRSSYDIVSQTLNTLHLYTPSPMPSTVLLKISQSCPKLRSFHGSIQGRPLPGHVAVHTMGV
eukprot:TRINITY_DN12074_c0_g1_i1.p1 TRINITY_DN12074_c0_g1~~TRINITY_DN12074_c0_g1_i1.p1  ORF type:complete len:659 (+),score=122.87 TRINITY_DN12074_c0_g1_i1:69-1979(+)